MPACASVDKKKITIFELQTGWLAQQVDKRRRKFRNKAKRTKKSLCHILACNGKSRTLIEWNQQLPLNCSCKKCTLSESNWQPPQNFNRADHRYLKKQKSHPG